MTTATQNRAKKGGEVGVNGEFYEGGKFLPSTERPKRDGSAPRRPRKVEVEPYKWVIDEAGRTPIFTLVGSQARWVDRYNPSLGITPDANGCAYYGDTFRGIPVAELCERFNRGERWVEGD